MKPVLQVALDFLNLKRALKVAQEAVAGGVDWVEVGTPLLKSEGLNAVREIRKLFPDITIVSDNKIMDAGRLEAEAAAKAGADVVCVLAAASNSTIAECVQAGKNYGIKIEADLIQIPMDRVKARAKELEEMGVDFLGVHCAIDEQMRAADIFKRLKIVSKAVSIPVVAAGGINSETAFDAVKSGASIVVVGGAITKAKQVSKAARRIKKAITQKKKIKSDLFKRVDQQGVCNIFKKVSTANISDALHRSGFLEGIRPLFKGITMAGPALTLRTYPGDWAKPVQAIDKAEPGQVLVVDAGGLGPAVWGELATQGAYKKKLAGLVVNGAVRDVKEIRKLKFAVFSKLIFSSAGEPKGLGEIDVPVTISGQRINSGDWIIGDDDGVICVPKEKVIEIANRAMAVLEQENRIRQEITEGSTLGKVMEIVKWQKKQIS